MLFVLIVAIFNSMRIHRIHLTRLVRNMLSRVTRIYLRVHRWHKFFLVSRLRHQNCRLILLVSVQWTKCLLAVMPSPPVTILTSVFSRYHFDLLGINCVLFWDLAARCMMVHLLQESDLINRGFQSLIGLLLGWVVESNISWFGRLGSLRWLLNICCGRNLHFIKVNSYILISQLRLLSKWLLCWLREVRVNVVETCLISFETEFKRLKPICYIFASNLLSHAMLWRRDTAPADILHLHFLPLWKTIVLSVLTHITFKMLFPDKCRIGLPLRFIRVEQLPPGRLFLLDKRSVVLK